MSELFSYSKSFFDSNFKVEFNSDIKKKLFGVFWVFLNSVHFLKMLSVILD